MSDPGFESDIPLRVMALHALAYCERLFYLEEVEELYVADDRVYAGRELHESLGAGGGKDRSDPDERGRPMSLELACPKLGLVGRVDVIKRRDGQFIPYEHKRGKARRRRATQGHRPLRSPTRRDMEAPGRRILPQLRPHA